jgi:hypothetical protein
MWLAHSNFRGIDVTHQEIFIQVYFVSIGNAYTTTAIEQSNHLMSDNNYIHKHWWTCKLPTFCTYVYICRQTHEALEICSFEVVSTTQETYGLTCAETSDEASFAQA